MGIRWHGAPNADGKARDKRTFRHFVRFSPDGSVEAIIALADGSHAAEAYDRGDDIDNAGTLHVDVTPLHPYDFTGVRVKPADVAAKRRDAIAADLKAQNKGAGKDRGGQ